MPAIVYLDVDDEITSAANRIREAGENRVALVVPYGSRLATSRINFRLLAREAQARGRRLSIVAGDAATRALAASAGLPVFGSVGEYEESDATSSAIPGVGDPKATESVGTRGRPKKPDAAAKPAPPEPDEGTAVAAAGAGAVAAASAAPVAGAASGPRPPEPDLEITRAVPTVRPVEGRRPARYDPPERGGSSTIPVARGFGRGTSLPFGRTAAAVVVAVVALALLASGVGAYLFLPSADITLRVRTDPIGPIPVEIRADTTIQQADPASGLVPAVGLDFDVAVSDTFPTTGKRVEADAAAGRVTFTSKNPIDTNAIANGAIVSTPNGIRFRTTAAVTIPRAVIVGLTVVPGEATVGVQAVEEGPEGNVEPNSITVIPNGEDPRFTEVRNNAPTTGGKREEFPQISAEELDAAIADLRGRLDGEWQGILADPSRFPAELTLFPETATLGEALPTTDPATLVGKEQPEFQMGLATTGSVIGVDQAPLEGIARARMTEAVDDGYQLVDGSIEIVPGDPSIFGNVITFPFTASAAQTPVVDANALRGEIRGKPIHEARLVLERFGAVELRTWPDWVTAIPTIDGRVQLRIETPTAIVPDASASDRPTPVPTTAPTSAPASTDPGLEGESPP